MNLLIYADCLQKRIDHPSGDLDRFGRQAGREFAKTICHLIRAGQLKNVGATTLPDPRDLTVSDRTWERHAATFVAMFARGTYKEIRRDGAGAVSVSEAESRENYYQRMCVAMRVVADEVATAAKMADRTDDAGQTITVKEAADAADVEQNTVRRAADAGKIAWVGTDRKRIDELSFRRWNDARQKDGRAHAERNAKPTKVIAKVPSYTCNTCRSQQATKGKCKDSTCTGHAK